MKEMSIKEARFMMDHGHGDVAKQAYDNLKDKLRPPAQIYTSATFMHPEDAKQIYRDGEERHKQGIGSGIFLNAGSRHFDSDMIHKHIDQVVSGKKFLGTQIYGNPNLTPEHYHRLLDHDIGDIATGVAEHMSKDINKYPLDVAKKAFDKIGPYSYGNERFLKTAKDPELIRHAYTSLHDKHAKNNISGFTTRDALYRLVDNKNTPSDIVNKMYDDHQRMRKSLLSHPHLDPKYHDSTIVAYEKFQPGVDHDDINNIARNPNLKQHSVDRLVNLYSGEHALAQVPHYLMDQHLDKMTNDHLSTIAGIENENDPFYGSSNFPTAQERAKRFLDERLNTK